MTITGIIGTLQIMVGPILYTLLYGGLVNSWTLSHLFLWSLVESANYYFSTAQSNDWIALPGAKIATILAGVFFVLLEVYWLALYWWRRIAGGRYQPSKRDFSALGFCWWLLSLYFIVVLTFLVGEISRKSDIVFGTVASSNGNNSSSDGGDGNVDVVLVRTALVSMVLYLYFCIAVFLVIKLEGIVSRRWNWKTQGSLLTV